MSKMYAVINKANEFHTKEDVLTGIFLMEVDAESFVRAQTIPSRYEVQEFDMDWNHWIEARKTLEVY